MPIYEYACENCGTKVEKITKNPNTEVPGRIANQCPTCRTVTKFNRVPTAAVFKTNKSASSVKEAVRSSQRTPEERATRMNNIKKGLTGDGRQPANLMQRSADAWGDAFSSTNPRLEDAKKELGRP